MTTNVTRNGAFPYYRWWSVEGAWIDGSTPVGEGFPPPHVSAAVALDATHVRVSYSQEMYHVNPANLNDATRPGNYVLDSLRNEPTVTNVTVHQANPTIVDLTLDHEMTQGDSYQVQVSNVLNLRDEPLEDGFDYANFYGIGVKPRVSVATATTITSVTVQFNEPMNTGGGTQLDNAARYVITGPTTVTVNTVTIEGSDIVTLHTSGEMLTGGPYTVTVGPPYTGIEDIYFNQLDAAYSAVEFTGLGSAPSVFSAAAADATHVTVDFNESMQNTLALRTAARYQFSGPSTVTAVSVSVTSSTRVAVEVTGEMQTGGTYTVTVTPTTGILDLAGNTLSATFNHIDFSGLGVAPQVQEATALDPNTVRVTFNEDMQDTAQIRTASRYTFTGPTTITAASVLVSSATTVDVTITGTMHDFGIYTVYVGPPYTGIVDLVGNSLDPAHHSVTFSGLAGYAQIVSASANTNGTIRVTYDSAMRRVNPASIDDATNPSNYALASGTGILRTPQSVAVVQASPTIVDVSVNGEMTLGATYTITVSNVLSDDGKPLDPAYDSADFSGYGVRPRVSSATATDSTTIQVVYNEDMENNGIVTNPAHYHISGGPLAVTATGADWDGTSRTTVNVTVSGEMRTGLTYTLTVGPVSNPPPSYVGLNDASRNSLDPAYHVTTFTGVGEPPRVLSATSLTYQTVRVLFNEHLDTLSAEVPGNYVILPALGVTLAQKLEDEAVTLTTEEQASGEDYTVTVSNVKDLAGNAVLPPHHQADFTGKGNSPPQIEFGFTDGDTGIAIRRMMSVRIYDPITPVHGIVQSACHITGTVVINNVTQAFDIVKNGELVVGMDGQHTGDPDTEVGLTYRFIPRAKWAANAVYTLTVSARDTEANVNTQQASFATGDAVCFEDKTTAAILPIETRLLQPMGPYTDVVRQVLLGACSYDGRLQTRARTLMCLATMTELRSLLAGVFDYSWVDGVKLCDRAPLLDVQYSMTAYADIARKAVGEVPRLTDNGKAMLLRYLQSNSSVYVVNAMALIPVLTAAIDIA